jgi:hypothetical protein
MLKPSFLKNLLNLIKKKKNQSSFLKQTSTIKTKLTISQLNLTYPYFNLYQSVTELETLKHHYERTFIIFKKLNTLTKLNFFINLPTIFTTYCNNVYKSQKISNQKHYTFFKHISHSQILTLYYITLYDKSLNKSYKLLFNFFQNLKYNNKHYYIVRLKKKIYKKQLQYLSIPTKLNIIKKLNTRPYLAYTRKKFFKKKNITRTQNSYYNTIKQKLNQLFKTQTYSINNKLFSKKYLKSYKIQLTTKQPQQKLINISKLKKSIYSFFIFKLFKNFFTEGYKQGILHYLYFLLKPFFSNLLHSHSKNLLTQQYNILLQQLNTVIKELHLKHYFQLKLIKNQQQNQTSFKQFLPYLHQLGSLILNACKNLQHNRQYNVKFTMKFLKQKPYLFKKKLLNPQTLQIRSKTKQQQLPSFNFLSLNDWVLGRISNYKLLRSRVPKRVKKKYYLPTFFTSIQELKQNIRIDGEFKNIFKFYFFPVKITLTDEMIKSLLYLFLEFWKLPTVSLYNIQTAKKFYTVFAEFFSPTSDLKKK